MRTRIFQTMSCLAITVLIFLSGCISVETRKGELPPDESVEGSAVQFSGTDEEQIKAFYVAWTSNVEGDLKRFCYRPENPNLKHILNIIYPFSKDKVEVKFKLIEPLMVDRNGAPVKISFIAINKYYNEALLISVRPFDQWLCRALIEITPLPVTEENLDAFLKTLNSAKGK